MNRQRGLSLVGLILIGFVAVLVAMLGIKLTPVVMEYWAVQKAVSAIVNGPEARGATVSDIRKAFDKRAIIDDIRSISGADLEVSKESGQVVIGFSYSKKVLLFSGVSLCLDLEGSTMPKALRDAP